MFFLSPFYVHNLFGSSTTYFVTPSGRYSIDFRSRQRIVDPAETIDLSGQDLLTDHRTGKHFIILKDLPGGMGGLSTAKYPIDFTFGSSASENLITIAIQGRFETTGLYAVFTKKHISKKLLTANLDHRLRSAVELIPQPFSQKEAADLSFELDTDEIPWVFSSRGLTTFWLANHGIRDADQRSIKLSVYFEFSNGDLLLKSVKRLK